MIKEILNLWNFSNLITAKKKEDIKKHLHLRDGAYKTKNQLYKLILPPNYLKQNLLLQSISIRLNLMSQSLMILIQKLTVSKINPTKFP